VARKAAPRLPPDNWGVNPTSDLWTSVLLMTWFPTATKLF
jgi:hypothetical protein